MNHINYRVSLDMFDTSSQTTIKAKKGDSACKIYITLTENGKIYSITEGCYATFSAKKSDGNFIYGNCTIEGNTIVYYFTSAIDENGVCQISACEGIVECEVTLYKSNSEKLTSPRFTLMIDGTVYNGEEIVSSTGVMGLKELIDEANTLIDDTKKCEEATENAISATKDALAVRAEIEAGGFIESLKEQNEGEKFSVWVGKKEEYDAITVKESNCLYIIEDDAPFADGIVEQGTTTVGDITWTYEKWASGKAVCWTVVTNLISNADLFKWNQDNTESCLYVTNKLKGADGIEYPFPFVEAPLETKSIVSSGLSFWIVSGDENSTTVSSSWGYCRASAIGSVATVKTALYVVGKWK